ncbi:MAG: hypothetical protein ACYC9O_06700 [Candidatus Latescibacterota bacterium]
MEEKKVCTGDHSCHLCVLTAKLPLEEIKPLVDNPQFICFNCGRGANSRKSLCNPQPLY